MARAALLRMRGGSIALLKPFGCGVLRYFLPVGAERQAVCLHKASAWLEKMFAREFRGLADCWQNVAVTAVLAARLGAVALLAAGICVGQSRAQTSGLQSKPSVAAASQPQSASSNAGDTTPAPPGDGAKVEPAVPAAGPVYHLLGFSLRGTKRVDLNALVAALPQHEGDLITSAEIKANAERIGAELAARHVHGNLTTAILEREGKGHYIWVIWDIQKMDAMSHLPLRAGRHFGSQSFTGNIRLSTDQLSAATGFHPGDPMPDGSVGDARTGIEQAYDKVLPGVPVAVKGAVALKKDDSVVIKWMITEPK
jgi:hypothetical protein